MILDKTFMVFSRSERSSGPALESKDGVCLIRSEQFIISDPQEHKSHFLINELVCTV
jgi:hypothetical protein